MFGFLDTPLPLAVPIVWGLMVAALAGVAVAVAGRRRRWALGLVAVTVLTAVVVVSVVFRRTGFDVQGRYVLPLLVLLPLSAGEVLYRDRRALDPRWARVLVAGSATLAAAAQLVGWWTNARRFAVGTDGPWLFIGRAEWAPPGGWTLWALVVAVAAACCALAGLAAAGTLRRGSTDAASPV